MARSLGLSRSDLETSPGVLELGVQESHGAGLNWPVAWREGRSQGQSPVEIFARQRL